MATKYLKMWVVRDTLYEEQDNPHWLMVKVEPKWERGPKMWNNQPGSWAIGTPISDDVAIALIGRTLKGGAKSKVQVKCNPYKRKAE